MRRLGIIGARGRLGRRIAEAAGAAGWRVTLTATRHGWIEYETPDVIVDASHVSAVPAVAAYCARSGCRLLEAVSGLDADAAQALGDASAAVAVTLAPNLSYGHHLQAELVALAAAASGASGWGAAVTDRHPPTKRDRPSATARELQRACIAGGVADARITCIRSGPPVSDHSVTFAGDGETLTVTHAVDDLGAAVNGALRAASWLVTASPGLWVMRDVWTTRRDLLATR